MTSKKCPAVSDYDRPTRPTFSIFICGLGRSLSRRPIVGGRSNISDEMMIRQKGETRDMIILLLCERRVLLARKGRAAAAGQPQPFLYIIHWTISSHGKRSTFFEQICKDIPFCDKYSIYHNAFEENDNSKMKCETLTRDDSRFEREKFEMKQFFPHAQLRCALFARKLSLLRNKINNAL